MGTSKLTVAIAVCILAIALSHENAIADDIKDSLDTEKLIYVSEIQAAQKEYLQAIDQQISSVSRTGDLDAAELLRTARKQFVASQVASTNSSLRPATAKYQEKLTTAEARLKSAYELALANYTKAGNFDDAQIIKRVITERFSSVAVAENPPSTKPSVQVKAEDTILQKLEMSKKEFVEQVRAAQQQLMDVIGSEAKAASGRGDLDSYKSLQALSEKVKSDVVISEDVKNGPIRIANAKLIRESQVEFVKLKSSYQIAIRDYTKAMKIDDAEDVKAEMPRDDWLMAFSDMTSATVAPVKSVSIYAIADDDFDLRINGRPILSGSQCQPTKIDDVLIKKSDLLAVRLEDNEDGSSFNSRFWMVVEDAQGKRLAITNSKDWKIYVPTDRDKWWICKPTDRDPACVSRNLRFDEFLAAARKVNPRIDSVADNMIWGDGKVTYVYYEFNK